jgi:dolichol-phosphate mannosyltransferase
MVGQNDLIIENVTDELDSIETAMFDVDHQDWLIQTIDHLRTQNIEQVNWESVSKELNNLAISEKREFQNSIRVLMTYLLGYINQSEFRPEISTSMIIEQFRQVEAFLLDSPSLKSYYLKVFADCYRKAVNDASVRGGLPVETFLSKPPFSPQDLLNTDFVFGLLKSSTFVRPHISVVIPVYKAEKCLHALYERLRFSLEEITPNFEIILVEDCGGDRSWEIILEIAQKDPRVKGIQFSRNFGQHYGITAGLDHCDGDWIVVMDCDLQDRPEEISKLYEKAQEGYDVVLAKRGKRKDPVYRQITSWLFYQVFNYFTDLQYNAEVGNFRIVSRKVVQNFCLIREQLRFFGGLIDWMGFPCASVQVTHEERFFGKSTYTFNKLWRLASETIIAYSDKPLRLAVKLGFIISTFALIYGAVIFFQAIFHGFSVTGWSSVIVSLYFLSGIIISILGMLGVYLGKAFDESKRRPLYLVRNSTPNFKISTDKTHVHSFI